MNLEGINAINKAINELGGCYPPQPITNTLLDLLNSSYPTQPHSLIINELLLLNIITGV